MLDYYSLGVLLYEILVGLPPFYDPVKHKMYQKIYKSEPSFPFHVSSEAQDLIARLLWKDPSERIGSHFGF